MKFNYLVFLLSALFVMNASITFKVSTNEKIIKHKIIYSVDCGTDEMIFRSCAKGIFLFDFV